MDKLILRKKWEDADLTDDYIFSKVMIDYDICLEVLRRILPQLKIKQIDFPNAQQELSFAPDAHSIRFDIYTTDENNNHYDIEMQVAKRDNLAKRIRYYQTASTMESYNKGEPYDNVDDSYVIFFCNFDPFGFDRQQYVLKKQITGTDKVIDDGETDILFDIRSKQHDVSPKMQNFLDMIARREVESDDELVVKLKERMEYVKHNRKWRAEYMRLSLYEVDQKRRLEKMEAKAREAKKAEQEAKKAEQVAKESEQRAKEAEQEAKKAERVAKESEQKAKKAEQEAKKAEQNAKNETKLVHKEGIEKLIRSLQSLNIDVTTIKREVRRQYNLTDEQLRKFLN